MKRILRNSTLLILTSIALTSFVYVLPTTNKLNIDMVVDDTFLTKVSRSLNINNTVISVIFSNISNENIIIEQPLCNWNLFITLYNLSDGTVNSNKFEFINPVIDSSSFIVLKPSEKIVYSYRFSNFGDYSINYSELKRVKLEYIPQEKTRLKTLTNLIIDKHIVECEF